MKQVRPPPRTKYSQSVSLARNAWNDTQFMSRGEMLEVLRADGVELQRVSDAPNDTTKWYGDCLCCDCFHLLSVTHNCQTVLLGSIVSHVFSKYSPNQVMFILIFFQPNLVTVAGNISFVLLGRLTSVFVRCLCLPI